MAHIWQTLQGFQQPRHPAPPPTPSCCPPQTRGSLTAGSGAGLSYARLSEPFSITLSLRRSRLFLLADFQACQDHPFPPCSAGSFSFLSVTGIPLSISPGLPPDEPGLSVSFPCSAGTFSPSGIPRRSFSSPGQPDHAILFSWPSSGCARNSFSILFLSYSQRPPLHSLRTVLRPFQVFFSLFQNPLRSGSNHPPKHSHLFLRLPAGDIFKVPRSFLMAADAAINPFHFQFNFLFSPGLCCRKGR